MLQHPTRSINITTTTLAVCNESLTHFQFQPPSPFDIFTGILMILIIIPSLAGNILIFYAFATNPKLRVVNNYFIMNLTLSDILTASLVIPFDANMKLNGINSWTHGAVMCKIWTTAYTISVPTSILTLCIVSIDRYQAISNPLGYRAGITLNKTKALCLIAGIWTLSLFMAFLPLVAGSPLNVTLSRDLPANCPDVYFCYFDISPSYSAAVTIIAFILPSIVMATLYLRMYLIITYERYIFDECRTSGRKGSGSNRSELNRTGRNTAENNQEGKKNEKTERRIDKDNGGENIEDENSGEEREKSEQNAVEINQNRKKNQRTETRCDKKRRCQNDQNKTEAIILADCGKNRKVQDNQDTSNNNENKPRASHPTASKNKKGGCDKHRNSQRSNNSEHNRNRSRPSTSNSTLHARHHHTMYQTKVARHFSVIVLVQLICWYPFSVESLVYNLCHDCDHISSSAQFFLLTIGYMSCAINPYLYAYQQRSFRQVFHRILGRKS